MPLFDRYEQFSWNRPVQHPTTKQQNNKTIMEEELAIHNVLKLVRTYRQLLDKKRRLTARLKVLREENGQLEADIAESRKHVESFVKMPTHDDRASYIQLVQSREKILHVRQCLKERRKMQHRLVTQLEPMFERLQLSTFPVFP